MNVTTNRDKDRIDLLFKLLGVQDDKDKVLLINNINEINQPLLDNVISGIIDGDGSFFISFHKDGNIKTGFNITNDRASRSLLLKIQERFNGIGSINEGTKNELVYVVTGINQITDILIPFIDKNPLYSERASHYNKFRLVSLMLKNNKPLTLKNKLEIVELAYDMNKKGKHRLLNKTEYITLLGKRYINNNI